VLLAHGADPRTRDDAGHTASDLAPAREAAPSTPAAAPRADELALAEATRPAAEAGQSTRRVQLAQPAAAGAAGGGSAALLDGGAPRLQSGVGGVKSGQLLEVGGVKSGQLLEVGARTAEGVRRQLGLLEQAQSGLEATAEVQIAPYTNQYP